MKLNNSAAIGAMSRFPHNGEIGPDPGLNAMLIHSALLSATFKGSIASMC